MAKRTISQERFDAVVSSFQEVAPDGVVSAYLFGSVAEGREHRESDIDVAVLLHRETFCDRKTRFEAGLRISAALQAALKTRKVDLVVLNDVPPLFGRRIVTEGHRFYCADGSVDRDFIRDIQLLAADLLPFVKRTRQTKLKALAGS